MSDEALLALDIGTRKVTALLVRREGSGMRVVASGTVEHSGRAMAAGQVEDVPKTAETVRAVLADLARRAGPLPGRAAVAVAGRNLRTAAGSAHHALDRRRPVSAQDMAWVEQAALRAAVAGPGGDAARGLRHLQCVGFVPVRWELDGVACDNPLDRAAAEIFVEVLATFLPRRVPEDLASVLEAVGLQADTITLEPIAALQAVIPPSLRRFNVALVDVGAGTSDIVAVREGIVRAFGMVPSAGDSVTDALCDHFLLDFVEAERLKRAAHAGERAVVRDIFGRELDVEPERVLEILRPAVESLARAVAAPLLELCGERPQAILCVGGGSLARGFTETLAAAAGMPLERVGVRAPEGVHLQDLPAAQSATPFGIALMACSGSGLRLRRCFLNGAAVHLIDSGSAPTILTALQAAGVAPQKIFGPPGLARTYTYNGALRAARGGAGFPASFELNGAAASLDAPVSDGDRISFEPGGAGAEGRVSLGEALAGEGIRAEDVGGAVDVFVDGRPAAWDMELRDLAEVTVGRRESPERRQPPPRPAVMSAKSWRVVANGSPLILDWSRREGRPLVCDVLAAMSRPSSVRRIRMLVDGREAGFSSPIEENAEISVCFD